MAVMYLLSLLWCLTSCVGSLIVVSLFVVWLYQFYLPKNYVPDLANRFVLITGCDSGFGHQLAKQLDQLGCRVIATCLTEGGKVKLRETCSKNVTTIIMDVTDQAAIDKAYEKVKELIPKEASLWGVVNNAGIQTVCLPTELLTLDQFQCVMNVNAWGGIRTLKTFLPLLKQSKGRVVNVVSAAARTALPLVAPYAMSKYAMAAFTDSARMELQQWGVSVHGIEPGVFATEITNKERVWPTFERNWETLSKAERLEYEDLKPHVRGVFAKTGKFSQPDITMVTNAIEHALFSKSAKPRYMVGYDNLFIFSWLSMMPSFVTDAVLRNQIMGFLPRSLKPSVTRS